MNIMNIECELSIDELKELYGISSNSFNCYDNDRNIYDDLSRIFGKEHVAFKTDQITENTICYIGNLHINEILPTYNLRYLYGSLFYELDYIYNLENLEKIFGEAIFYRVKYAFGLENLSFISNDIAFYRLFMNDGLESLEYVSGFHIDDINKVAFNINQLDYDKETYIGNLVYQGKIKGNNIKNFVGELRYYNSDSSYNLDNLEKVYGSLDLNRTFDSDLFKNLKIVNGSLNIPSIRINTSLKYVELLNIRGKVFDDTVLPKIKTLSIYNETDINHLSFKNGVEEVYFERLINIKNTYFPNCIRKLLVNECNLSQIKLPSSLEKLYINDIKQLNKSTIHDSTQIDLNGKILSKEEIEKHATIIYGTKIKRL